MSDGAQISSQDEPGPEATREELLAYFEQEANRPEGEHTPCRMCGSCCERLTIPDIMLRVYDFFELIEEEVDIERQEMAEALDSTTFDADNPRIGEELSNLTQALADLARKRTVKKWYRCKLLGPPEEWEFPDGVRTIRRCPLHDTDQRPAVCRYHPVRATSRAYACQIEFSEEPPAPEMMAASQEQPIE